MAWSADGWLRTEDGQGIPVSEVTAPALPPHPFQGESVREDFDGPRLPAAFQWLRTPFPDELFSLAARPGHLRLYGRETIGSQFRQALVARRQQAFCYSAATAVEVEPQHFQQMAGLVCYYNSSKFHYLHISHDPAVGKHVRVMSCLPDQVQSDAFTPPIAIPSDRRVHLRVEVDYERLRFAYRVEGSAWQWLPQQFDTSILSDEATAPGLPNFTGAFVGMACQDMAGTGMPADFDYFEYQERDYRPDPAPISSSPE
jgi:xylan 1,4-beta-xylosidase